MFSLAASSVVGQAVTNELCAYILSLFKIHNYEYCTGNSFFAALIQVFKPVASATHISNSVCNDCVIQERR